LRKLLGGRRLRTLLLSAISFRAWMHRRWCKGLLETVASALFCFRFLPYRRELVSTPQGREYCVWWPPSSPRKGRRCWVLLPGGMSSGRDFYITSLGTSAAIAEDESWAVFHNPGQGGSRCQPEAQGLSRTDCLANFLERIRDQFDHIVVVGFSAGGMPALKMAQEESPIADAFVGVCSPDRIRLVFEEQSRWLCRLDVFFSIWFYFCARAAGLTKFVPFKKFPWPPTWHGYMKPFTEKTFEVSTGESRTFEQLERQHFDGSVVRPATVPCLRILCSDDPIVPSKTLEHERLKHCEVWWEPRGGHCGQFFCAPDLAQRLREWVLKGEQEQGKAASAALLK